MERERSLLLEGSPQASFKLSPAYLASDEARPIILKVISNQKYREIVRKNEAGAFSEEDLRAQAMYEEVINLDEVVTAFVQSGAEARWKEDRITTFLLLVSVSLPSRGGRKGTHHVLLSDCLTLRKPTGNPETSSDSTINMNTLKYIHSDNYGFKYTNTR